MKASEIDLRIGVGHPLADHVLDLGDLRVRRDQPGVVERPGAGTEHDDRQSLLLRRDDRRYGDLAERNLARQHVAQHVAAAGPAGDAGQVDARLLEQAFVHAGRVGGAVHAGSPQRDDDFGCVCTQVGRCACQEGSERRDHKSEPCHDQLRPLYAPRFSRLLSIHRIAGRPTASGLPASKGNAGSNRPRHTFDNSNVEGWNSSSAESCRCDNPCVYE